MNPTAEDILNKYRKMNWDHDYAENGILSFDDAKKAMEECSLLKSKEAADKAWETCYNCCLENGLGAAENAPNKETFMKELFKDQRS